MNPLFNANRLKLGIFGTNGKGGAQTLVPEAYQPTWRASVETARMADTAGFEAVLAYARWKGYIPGQPSHPSGVTLDPFTWCAGIAQATARMAVIPTVHWCRSFIRGSTWSTRSAIPERPTIARAAPLTPTAAKRSAERCRPSMPSAIPRSGNYRGRHAGSGARGRDLPDRGPEACGARARKMYCV